MSSLVLSFYDLHSLFLTDLAGVVRPMLQNETGKGLPHDKADIYRFAGIFLRRPATTVNYGDVVWIFQDDISGVLIGYNGLQVGQ